MPTWYYHGRMHVLDMHNAALLLDLPAPMSPTCPRASNESWTPLHVRASMEEEGEGEREGERVGEGEEEKRGARDTRETGARTEAAPTNIFNAPRGGSLIDVGAGAL